MGETRHEVTDLELVSRTLGGDRRAFGDLWDRHHRRVYGYCHRYLGEREAAEDATAECFRRALEKLDTFAGSRFAAWLFRIAHNVVCDELRRRGRIVAISAAAELADTEPPESPPGAVELTGLLAGLSPDQRAVVELRLAGLTPSEIAAALGKSRPAVDMLAHRAIARLRGWLVPNGSTEGGRRDGRA